MFWDHSLQDLFFKGGFAMYPLLACSVIALAVVLDRLVVLISLGLHFAKFVERIQPLVTSGQLEQVRQLLRHYRSPVARVAAVYVDHIASPPEVRDKAVALEGSQQLARLERRMDWLRMIASIATLLGLLGTVSGLVTAFHEIELRAGMVQPGDLAGGIWAALLTTVFGLVIAIPCMAVFHLLDNRVGVIGLQMQWIAMYLEQWLHQANTRTTSTPERPRAPATSLAV